MLNLQSVLRQEIRRFARKEVHSELEGVRPLQSNYSKHVSSGDPGGRG